jgi:spore coat protein U-like protein
MLGKLLRFTPLMFLVLRTQAGAGTYSGSFSVLASVANTCSVGANAFNAPYNPTSPVPLTGTSIITVQCTLGDVFHVQLNQGLYGVNVTHRVLSDGIQTLSYFLYRDPAMTLNWGQTNGVDTVDSTGTGLAQSFTIYGMTPALQNVSPGVYTDTVQVTVSF